MNQDDRRVKKTERDLRNALSELMAVKPLHTITIQELTEKADIHRGTFYKHYCDIYDFYEKTENSFMKMLQEYIVANPTHDYKMTFSRIVDYLETNQWCHQIFFGKNAQPSFENMLFDFLTERYLEISAYEESIAFIPEKWRILAHYHIGGTLSLFKYWIQNGCQTPGERPMELVYAIDLTFDKIFEDI